MGSGRRRTGHTVVGDPPLVIAIICALVILAGIAAGFGLDRLLGWLLTLPWVPFSGPLRLIDSLPDPLSLIILAAAGAVAGTAFAVVIKRDLFSVVVSDQTVLVQRGSRTLYELSGSAIKHVFVDGKELVVHSLTTTELLREKTSLPAAALAAAFRQHGYSWLERDPTAADFRRWVPGIAGLPPGADALLKARAAALGSHRAEDLRELRQELGRLGIVVRDQADKQYVRATTSVES